MNGGFLAFDLGGTRLKAGLVRTSDGTVEKVHTESVGGDISQILDTLAEVAERIRGGSVEGAGLCVPGLVSPEGKVVDLPGKLQGIVGMDLRRELAERIGADPVITNDAVAYAVGEASFGGGKGASRCVVMTIGTGVGVTVVEEGLPATRGMLGGGILGGFIPISDRSEGPRDSSGQAWSIEALCAAERIVTYANEAGGSFASVQEVYEAHVSGDSKATAGIESYRRHLCRAVVALAHAHAPEVVIVGGGPMTPDNPVTLGLEAQVNERLWGNFRVRVKRAELGDAAALAGLSKIWERTSR